MTLLYGLDLGTSTIKAAAYDPEVGRTVALCARPTPVEHLANGWSEHDPEALWQAAAGCLRELRQQVPDRAVAGLAIASFAEAGIALDQHLRPLYPIIAWYDRRTEAQAKWWEAQIDPVALHAITGQQLSPTFGANKWLWIREHIPAAATRLGAWLSVPDYVLWRLTGELATDYSLASRTMLFDQAACGWSPPLLAGVGLTPGQLPRLAPAGTVAGAVIASAAAETGLPPGTPCALGGHDHLCAAFAAGAYKPGSVVDSAGTAEAVMALVPGFHTGPELAALGYACYRHVAPGQYILKAGLKASGGAVEWLARQLAGGPLAPGEPVPYEALLAEAADGVGRRAGPIWLPHLIGSGTPEGDQRSRAALVGAAADHSRGDLFRGLLEGLACWLRANVERMAECTDQPAREVVLLGGTARLGLLAQLKADVLGLPVVVPDVPEATATGAALLAGLGAGVFAGPGSAIASLSCGRQVLAPDLAKAEWYDRLYRTAYVPLYAALRDVNHALVALDGR